MNTRLSFPRGLRVRLVAAFLLAAAFGALLTAGLTFQQARSAILERTQDSAVADLRTQLDSLAPDLTMPPSNNDLRDLTLQLDRAGGARAWRSSASYQGGDPVPASPDAPPVPRGLRETVRDTGEAAYERTERDGRPWLSVGMPVAYTHDPTRPTSAGKLSGLTVYASFPLDDDQADIAALVTAARTGAIPSLVLAVIPALFAARSVLRPVRRLRSGAERVAAGRFDTRLDAEGHDELADLTRSFNTMAATLQKDDAELRRMEAGARRFAADVAHELRTPLAAMVAVTEVLDEDAASGALPADTADAVRLISEETRKIARMVEDLMEVSRFDAKAAALDAEDLDLRAIVSKTLRLRGWADDERVRTDLPTPVPVHADPRRVDVVLANLIGNALRHGSPPVTVSARVEYGKAVVTVTDQGPGIPGDVLPHVFERFYKADAARTRSEGSGLGLAIAQENVLLHGGTLTAGNTSGRGAVFILTLPLAASPQEQR
ncbi:sensor histidine kinase [Streptomyces clavuligerus]|uniref:histidine kinase n=1 Tax=Streptomyces clavuligerus TaxID=1901 RepID=B5GYH6_STRCL|nr:HAMP domain-containing sensor histidine kinase [Streptomyces clavuligerus]ANW17019.1 two-component sensor histidine kinase [Streptomyces clavuligerus]AXU11554.1 sensor histidine kinase [Streptomyces clavuligerus]EDY51372.1 two component system histidine kinase [Streptomyces clavuligerus]EFG10445.1 two component system histidine kinase [Streptomyces clavuligerus]MBY6301374.1 HAMP domain-containing histidine kinase [Streptomyces clavuligerus]